MTLYISNPVTNKEKSYSVGTLKEAIEILEDEARIRNTYPMSITHRLIDDKGEDISEQIRIEFDLN